MQLDGSAFPGNPDGSLAERLAHRLLGLIAACDDAMDMHTPTRGGRYVPIGILHPDRLGADARRAEELAVAFGSGYVMKTDAGMYVRDGILGVEATRRGIPAFTFETGESGRLEPDLVTDGVPCVLNALRHLGMLPGKPGPPAWSGCASSRACARRGAGCSSPTSPWARSSARASVWLAS